MDTVIVADRVLVETGLVICGSATWTRRSRSLSGCPASTARRSLGWPSDRQLRQLDVLAYAGLAPVGVDGPQRREHYVGLCFGPRATILVGTRYPGWGGTSGKQGAGERELPVSFSVVTLHPGPELLSDEDGILLTRAWRPAFAAASDKCR
ncbi:hypothetical protein [Nonomuraea rosea]|uniref:hypothetical protein n=1 Tax=Nonomuraea rosea TaxID=638574 RepID=UPI0031ED3701